MSSQQLFESSQVVYDAENQSFSEDRLVDNRYEDDEDDELTRKIKAIPILPRIPKLKKSNNVGEDKSNLKVLEHRSVLHRKEFLFNSEDALKWPTNDLQTFDRSRRKNFNSDHNPEKKIFREHTSGGFHNKKTDTSRSQSSIKPMLTCRNPFRAMTAEEKFDQLTSKTHTDSKEISADVSSSESSNCSSNVLSKSAASEFDYIENTFLNSSPIKPYKTLEERRQERMRKGLMSSSADLSSIVKSDKNQLDMSESVPNLENNNKKTLGEISNNQTESESIADSENVPAGLNFLLNNLDKNIDQTSGMFTNTGSEASNSSSIGSSQVEVIDMDIGNSPYDNIDGDTAKPKPTSSRKVTFNCPETEDSKNSIFPPKKQLKKKPADNDQNAKKGNCQEHVVSIMKDFLKPYYSKQKITKDEYKEIMRKVVPKFSKSRKEDIKKEKIEHYAEKYVKIIVQKKNKA